MDLHRYGARFWLLSLAALSCVSCGQPNDAGQELDEAGHLAPRHVDSWQKVVERHAPTVAQMVQLPWQEEVVGVELSRDSFRAHFAGDHLQGKRVPEPIELTPEQQGQLQLHTWGTQAFYDPVHPHAVHFADDLPAGRRDVVARHELMHALQHQHFDLTALTVAAATRGRDAVLAFDAVVEGQASAVEEGWQAPTVYRPRNPRLDADALFNGHRSQAVAPQAGQVATPAQAAIALVTRDHGAGLGNNPVHMLPHLQRLFPYQVGRSFIETLAQRSSLPQAIRQTLQRPPVSTREVLHPEVYLRGETPEALAVQELRAAWGRPDALELTMGEFVVAVTLGGGEAAFRVAEGWRADVLLYDRAHDENVSVTLWRDAAAAEAFVAALLVAEAESAHSADPDLQVLDADGAAPSPPNEVNYKRLGRAVIVAEGRPGTTEAAATAVADSLLSSCIAGVAP